MLVNSSSTSSNSKHIIGMNSPTGSCGSVRLRRREHRSTKDLEMCKRQNRHSGDIGNWSPRILSPRLFKDISERRQSGDWSYVSFPSSPGTPKAQFSAREFVSPPTQEGPTSLLESKIIASILENEATSKSAHGSPHRYTDRRNTAQMVQTPPPPRCRSAMETLDRKVNTGSVGVRRKLLGNNRIEEEDRLLLSSSTPNYRPVPSSKNAVSKVKRRSQSSHHHRQENCSHRFSEVIDTSSEDHLEETKRPSGGGLGRRSATQWELSRRKTPNNSSETEDSLVQTPSQHRHRSRKQKENQEFLRWKSQEHVDQLFTNESYDDDYGNEDEQRRRDFLETQRSVIPDLCEEEEEDDEEEVHQDKECLEINGEVDPFNSTLKKGLLWQQRDKIFSRWKERFFILTKDYLQCFKKENHSRLSEMGGFIFKLKLSEVELVELVDKKGYLTVSLSLPKDGKVLLRKNEGIRDWFILLKNCVHECRARGCMKSTEEFWSKKNFQDSPHGSPSNFDRWLLARQRIGQQCNYVVNGAVSASEDFMSLPVVSSPIDAEYYHRKSRQLKDITSPLTNHRTPSKSRRSTSRNNHLNYVDIGSPCDSPRDNQRKSLFVSDNNFDSGNDSMNTNTSTGGSTDSSNKEIRSRSKSRGPVIPENDYESLKHSKDKFRDRSTTDVQRFHKREIDQNKSNYRRSQFISPAQSTRV